VSNASTDQIRGEGTLKLGELLYADPAVALVSEKQWLALVRAIAAGDELALRLLYEKAFPVVSTYLMRLTGNRQLADTLILDVFERVWCEAPLFEAVDGPVLGWIMRQARSLGLKYAGSGRSADQDSGDVGLEVSADPVPMTDADRPSPTGLALQRAIEALTMDEYRAIEATVLNGWSYAEFAERCGQPVGTIKSQIRSGLAKLQHALQARSEET
jgi:RNA polymerase sigma-70 factor (ECF subfamily)